MGCFKPVFKQISSVIDCQLFETMYFGFHSGKNLLILKYEVSTLLVVFRNGDHSLTPEFVKSVTEKENYFIEGIEIVSNENVILLLDKYGNLWRLNTYEVSQERDEFYLNEECMYEWVPYKPFSLDKVFALTAFTEGFAFIGLNQNSKKRLKFSFSARSEDYAFEELNSEPPSCFLINIKNENLTDEVLLVADKVCGKSYIVQKDGQRRLLSTSSTPLVSVLSFEQKKSVLLCYQTGKLSLYFYDLTCHVIYLPKKLVFVKKCSCGSCILWSDGFVLHHTKLKFDNGEKFLGATVNLNLKGVISYVNIHNGGVALTVNNIYYHIDSKFIDGFKAEKDLTGSQALSRIYQSGLKINELCARIEQLKEFLLYKELFQNGETNVQVSSDGRHLNVKCSPNTVFKQGVWRMKLEKDVRGKRIVKIANVHTTGRGDLSVEVEPSFLKKGQINFTLLGDFNEVDEPLLVGFREVIKGVEEDGKEVKDTLYQIAAKRNSDFKKEKVSCEDSLHT